MALHQQNLIENLEHNKSVPVVYFNLYELNSSFKSQKLGRTLSQSACSILGAKQSNSVGVRLLPSDKKPSRRTMAQIEGKAVKNEEHKIMSTKV